MLATYPANDGKCISLFPYFLLQDGGSNPVWNESFLFEIPNGPTQLDIIVYDEEKHGSDDVMGSVR